MKVSYNKGKLTLSPEQTKPGCPGSPHSDKLLLRRIVKDGFGFVPLTQCKSKLVFGKDVLVSVDLIPLAHNQKL